MSSIGCPILHFQCTRTIPDLEGFDILQLLLVATFVVSKCSNNQHHYIILYSVFVCKCWNCDLQNYYTPAMHDQAFSDKDRDTLNLLDNISPRCFETVCHPHFFDFVKPKSSDFTDKTRKPKITAACSHEPWYVFALHRPWSASDRHIICKIRVKLAISQLIMKKPTPGGKGTKVG